MKAREWSPQKRRIVVLCGALLIGFGLLWFYFVATEKPPAPPKKPDSSGSLSDGQTKSILAPGAQVDPREAWMATAGKEVSKIGDRVGKMEDTQQQVMQTQKRIESELLPKLTEAIEKSKAEAAASAATNVVPPAPRASALSGVTPVNPRGFPPDNALSAPPRGTVPIRQPGQLGAGDYQSGIEDSPALAAGQPRAMLRLSSLREEASAIPGNTAGISPPAAPAAATSPAKKPRTVENYLPVSFTPAILLGGIDAPTGGQSQSNPHPALMRLESDAMLPNRFRGHVKECLVIGAGYGDISSERCYIRTERLSCVKEDGGVIETKLTGSIFGEDGKVGMRGRLVEKQGQLLGNALMSGVISGIGQSFQSRASTVATSPLGSTTSVNSGREFEAGLGVGVSRAMDRLAQYYISLAEKVFPVIECDAGRKVDVVVTEGIAFDDEASATTSATRATRSPRPLSQPSRLEGSERNAYEANE